MSGTSRRRLVIEALAIAAAGAGLIATTALAGSGTMAGGRLSYTALPGQANYISVAVINGHVAIYDSGGLAPTSDCVAGTGALTGDLDCGVPAGLVGGIAVRSGDGMDSVNFDPTLAGTGIPSLFVDGGAGDDWLTNAAGVPATFVGGPGADTVNGSGLDTVDYSSSTAGVTVNLLSGSASGDGSDWLGGVANVVGTPWPDVITGDWRDNVISGGGGNDMLTGGSGDNTLNGGSGDDIVSYDGSWPITANLAIGQVSGAGPGTDTLTAIESVQGSAESDVLIGDAGNNVLLGGGGDDVLSGGGGSDVLQGDQGTDTVDYTTAPTGVTGVLDAAGDGQLTGDGTDVVQGIERIVGSPWDDTLCAGAAQTVLGNAGDDVLTATGAATIRGGSGADIIDASGDPDPTTLDGGPGDDVITGGTNTDVLTGGIGADWIAGGGGVNTLQGGPGDDTLNGQGDAGDFIDGGIGNDRLTGGPAPDAISGGEGNDAIDLGPGFGGDSGVTGGPGDDTITGSAGSDLLSGGDGSDRIDGAGGDDLVVGDAGNDTLYGSSGSDTVDGGEGNDALLGGGGSDVLMGGPGEDSLDGQSGFDGLSGGPDDDVVHGGLGNDSLEGGDGSDLLFGDAGADVLTGGQGDDVLDGGADADTVSYDLSPAAEAIDTVTGVTTGGDGTDSLSGLETLVASGFDDTLNVRDGTPESVTCGAGSDSVTADIVDTVQPDCEQVVTGPPDPPTDVIATAGDQSVTLDWTAPADTGGAPILGYVVTPYVGTTALAPIDTGSASPGFTVTGLTDAVSYGFTVQARNVLGLGAPSEPTVTAIPGGRVSSLILGSSLPSAGTDHHAVPTLTPSWSTDGVPAAATGIRVCLQPTTATVATFATCPGGVVKDLAATATAASFAPVAQGVGYRATVWPDYAAKTRSGLGRSVTVAGSAFSNAASVSIGTDATATLKATLRRAGSTTVLVGQTVTLWQRPAGATAWTKMALTTLKTSSTGVVTQVVRPGRTTSYQWRYAGSTHQVAATGTEVVHVG